MASRILIAAFTLQLAVSQKWTQFRGPDGRGLASGSPPSVFAANDKAQVWKTRVPFGQSSPSIWGDRIFLTLGDRKGKNS